MADFEPGYGLRTETMHIQGSTYERLGPNTKNIPLTPETTAVKVLIGGRYGYGLTIRANYGGDLEAVGGDGRIFTFERTREMRTYGDRFHGQLILAGTSDQRRLEEPDEKTNTHYINRGDYLTPRGGLAISNPKAKVELVLREGDPGGHPLLMIRERGRRQLNGVWVAIETSSGKGQET